MAESIGIGERARATVASDLWCGRPSFDECFIDDHAAPPKRADFP